jgi:hypothetical protein
MVFTGGGGKGIVGMIVEPIGQKRVGLFEVVV